MQQSKDGPGTAIKWKETVLTMSLSLPNEKLSSTTLPEYLCTLVSQKKGYGAAALILLDFIFVYPSFLYLVEVPSNDKWPA